MLCMCRLCVANGAEAEGLCLLAALVAEPAADDLLSPSHWECKAKEDQGMLHDAPVAGLPLSLVSSKRRRADSTESTPIHRVGPGRNKLLVSV